MLSRTVRCFTPDPLFESDDAEDRAFDAAGKVAGGEEEEEEEEEE